MNTISNQSSSSRYHGYVMLATIVLLILLAISAILIRFGTCDNVVRRYDKMDAKLAAQNVSEIFLDEPKVGLVKGIVYNPPNSCAVINEKIVHVGDAIHGVVVVGIQDNAVEFSKAGVTWQQKVLETPHEAWPSSAKADCPAG